MVSNKNETKEEQCDDEGKITTDDMGTLPISSIVWRKRGRSDLGNIDALVQSIAEIGLIHPIVVTRDCRLFSGRRRLAACSALGWRQIPVSVVDVPDIVRVALADYPPAFCRAPMRLH
jgi:ParB-like chromosome segregation protein Spo0J